MAAKTIHKRRPGFLITVARRYHHGICTPIGYIPPLAAQPLEYSLKKAEGAAKGRHQAFLSKEIHAIQGKSLEHVDDQHDSLQILKHLQNQRGISIFEDKVGNYTPHLIIIRN